MRCQSAESNRAILLEQIVIAPELLVQSFGTREFGNTFAESRRR